MKTKPTQTQVPQLNADQWVLLRLLQLVANSPAACSALAYKKDFSRALQYAVHVCGGYKELQAACSVIEEEERQEKEARKAKEEAARRAALASGDDTWIGG
jgi:hypothetical protein